MNTLLWFLQVLLALHTVMGAVWKLSHSSQSVPSLKAIPQGAWLALIGLELVCSACLILPALGKRLSVAAGVGAACIAAEMLLFVALHLRSGETQHGQMIYWLVVAALCAFIAYGRLALKPV